MRSRSAGHSGQHGVWQPVSASLQAESIARVRCLHQAGRARQVSALHGAHPRDSHLLPQAARRRHSGRLRPNEPNEEAQGRQPTLSRSRRTDTAADGARTGEPQAAPPARTGGGCHRHPKKSLSPAGDIPRSARERREQAERLMSTAIQSIEADDARNVRPMLRALGLSRATFYRASKQDAPAAAIMDSPIARACPVPGRRLSEEEREIVRQLLYSKQFVDLTPTEVFAGLLDGGAYHCSIRTMYRLLKEEGATTPRTRADRARQH